MTPAALARLLALPAAVALLAGCGARVTPDTPRMLADHSSAATAAPAPAASAAPGPDHVPDGAPGAPQAAASGPTPAAEPDVGSRHGNGVVSIALSAGCVSPGDLLVVTLTTPPNAGLGMVIGYADNAPHGAMNTGKSDAGGSYVWRVPVAPTVPEGTARVLVTSTGANREGEGGTADEAFTVSRGGCA